MELLIIILLILLNGFFALSEIALISSKPAKLEELKNSGSKGAEKALSLICNSERFLSSIQVGITLISLITGLYGGSNLAIYIAPFFEKISFLQNFAMEISLVLSVLFITYISIVLGELVPKTFALSKPEKISAKVAPIITTFSKIFSPFVRLLEVSTNFLSKILGIKKQTQHITESELRQMMKTAYREGVIEKGQNILHEKVFTFSDKKAKHIMTYRTDIQWIDIKKPSEQIIESLRKINHNKVVCCDGNIDNFLGFSYLRDIFKSYSTKGILNIEEHIIPPTIVYENTEAQKLLTQLQEEKIHFWFVINEFGTLEGIITLHDITEGILGEIPNEYTIEEPDIFVREDGSMLVNGDAPVEKLMDVVEYFTIDYHNVKYSTVAGFIFEMLDKMPCIGDKFIYLDYSFEIVDMDGNRINKVLISKA